MAPGGASTGASTVTKILYTIAGILAAISAITWPTGTSPTIGAYAGVGAVLVTAVASIIHTIWDHSP